MEKFNTFNHNQNPDNESVTEKTPEEVVAAADDPAYNKSPNVAAAATPTLKNWQNPNLDQSPSNPETKITPSPLATFQFPHGFHAKARLVPNNFALYISKFPVWYNFFHSSPFHLPKTEKYPKLREFVLKRHQ